MDAGRGCRASSRGGGMKGICMSEKKNIVIVGGGYAGLAVAILLESNKLLMKRAEIYLIDRVPYHLIKTELHSVATGALSPSRAALPLNQIIGKKNIKLLTTAVTRIDPDAGCLFAGKESIPFDILVLATGGANTTFGIPGVAEHALPLKTLDDALRIRDRLRNIAREARSAVEKARIVVVGAGPTGVETAAYMIDRFRRDKIPAYKMPCVTLIEGGSTILPGGSYTRSVRKKAAHRMQRHGVNMVLNSRVTKVTTDMVYLNTGVKLRHDLLIWGGGLVADTALLAPLNARLGPMARAEAAPGMFLENAPHIFVLGDAAMARYGAARKPLPCSAQYALQQAEVVAHNAAVRALGRGQIKSFIPDRRGEFVSIGNKEAVAWMGPVEMLGRDAQLLKNGILAKYLAGIGVNPAQWFLP